MRGKSNFGKEMDDDKGLHIYTSVRVDRNASKLHSRFNLQIAQICLYTPEILMSASVTTSLSFPVVQHEKIWLRGISTDLPLEENEP